MEVVNKGGFHEEAKKLTIPDISNEGVQMNQQFASDNYAGICPEALKAIVDVNQGHERPYGEDRWTAEACERFREVFEVDCEVFFVLNGTAGNALSMASLCQSYHGIICNKLAHVETDECGAPEFFSHGSKLLTVEGEQGKIVPQDIEEMVNRRDDIHFPKPKVVCLTQATELGQVYRLDELHAIRDVARSYALKIQMDGARFANAVAQLEVAPRALTADAGVDVLSLGGSKNGLAMGEAILFFDLEAADEFAYRCKQAGQLASKMRFIAAQWLGLLKDDTWLRYARHTNACAAMLEQQLRLLPAVEILYPRESNAVFVQMPPAVMTLLEQKDWLFYTFIGAGMRLMCSWDTTEESIKAFITDLKACLIEATSL